MAFEVKDSGKRQEFTTGSVRDTQEGKGRFDLIPPYPLLRLAQHFENGAKKYGDRNWEKGQPLHRYLDSAIRHINTYIGGDRVEDHLTAAVWNLMAYVHTEHEVDVGRLPDSLRTFPPQEEPKNKVPCRSDGFYEKRCIKCAEANGEKVVTEPSHTPTTTNRK